MIPFHKGLIAQGGRQEVMKVAYATTEIRLPFQQGSSLKLKNP